MCLGQKGLRYFLAIITSIWGKNSIVTNTLYTSIVKQKIKTNGSMVKRKGLFSMVWREKKIPAQCSRYWTKILGEYIYIYIYICMYVCMWGTNGIVWTILSEWACRLIMGNAKTESLMGKKICLWLIGGHLWAWNRKEMSETKWLRTGVVYL